MVAIDGYGLEEMLGEGAFGSVYVARHEATGTRRALKLMRVAAGPVALARFGREMETLARAAGPGVVTVHASGVAAGRPYFVMDLMRGGSLRERLAKGPLPSGEALGIVTELARALERCHALGLVHRDVKPDNILFDEQGRPCLADFGIVKDLSALALTKTGAIVGTPSYASLEQLAGTAVDGRADVYALGVVLYEAVTGRVPFSGETLLALLTAVESGRHERASSLASVPAGFDALVARALARREQRFPSAAAFVEALEELCSGKPPARRPRAAILAAVGLVLAGGAVLLVRGSSPASPPSASPPAPVPPAVLDRPEAPAVARPAAAPPTVSPVDSATARAAMNRARLLSRSLVLTLERDRACELVEDVAKELDTAARGGVMDPEVALRVRDVMVLVRAGLSPGRHLAITLLVFAHDPDARSQIYLADDLARRGHREEARAFAEPLLDERRVDLDVFVSAANFMALYELDRGHGAQALALAERAHALTSDDPDNLLVLGRAQLAVGAIDSALATTRSYADISFTEKGTQNEALLHELRGHTLLVAKASPEEALRELDLAASVFRRPKIFLDRARARFRVGRVEDARKDLDEAISIGADPAEAGSVAAELSGRESP